MHPAYHPDTPSVGLSKLVKKRKKVAGAQAVPALAAEIAIIDLVSSSDDEQAVENEVFVGAMGDGDSILQSCNPSSAVRRVVGD